MSFSRYAKIALFFIVVGSLGCAYIIASANGMNDFNSNEYVAVLADATGLSTRSKMYLAGVVVGRVKAITLVDNEAVLRLGILKKIKIYENAVISRKSSSILGTSILNLNPGSESRPLLAAGGRIGTLRDTSDMNAVIGTVQDLGGQVSGLLKDFQENQLALLSVSLETFNSIAKKINDRSDEELLRISRILESVALITERTERIFAQADINGTGPVGDVNGTLRNIRMISEEIRLGRGNVGQAIYDDQLYNSFLSTMQGIEVAVVKLQDTLDSINSAAQGASTVIGNANVIVEKAVGLGVQVDTSASYLTSANQVQAGASIRLTPESNDRWYRIGVSSVPNGVSSRTVRETLDAQGNVRVYKDTTETKYSTMAIDAELARRFGIVTIRGGLLESTAGFGLDVQPVRWASASAEVFNFKNGELPNLRGTLTVYPFFDPNSDKPWNWVYLKGGISDSLNDSRDFFVGGGIRFADREIKGLVGLVPALNN